MVERESQVSDLGDWKDGVRYQEKAYIRTSRLAGKHKFSFENTNLRCLWHIQMELSMWVVGFVAQGRKRYRLVIFHQEENNDQKSRFEITDREKPRRKSQTKEEKKQESHQHCQMSCQSQIISWNMPHVFGNEIIVDLSERKCCGLMYLLSGWGELRSEWKYWSYYVND